MHTKRSPSQAKKFGECPGTLAFCEALPDHQKGVSGEAARIGTCAHGLIEECLKKGTEPESYRDRIIEIVNEGEDNEGVTILRKGAKTPGNGRVWYVVDSAMIDGATLMTDYVRGRCEELGVKAADLQLETRTNPLPERDDTSGTADVTIDAWPTLLEVVDYKNGYMGVDHVDNDQLRAYLLGKALEAGMTHESYRVTVVQPNGDHEEGRTRGSDYTKEELLAFQVEYAARIARCEEAEDAVGAPTRDGSDAGFHYTGEWATKHLKAGDHCTFCDGKPVCPAYKAARQIEAAVDFADEPTDVALASGDDAEVARVLMWAPKLEALIAAARAWAYRSLEAGRPFPGHKLVRGKSNRAWRDMDEAALVKAIVKGGFVDDKAKLYTKPELITGPAAEKLMPKKLRKDFSAKFMVKPEGKLTLAPEDDPREAVVLNVADDFASLPADEYDFG